MSVLAMAKVWRLMALSQGEAMVMLALADWANDDLQCWPSMPQIARKARVTERGLRGIIGRLVDKGYLVRDERCGKGVLYTLMLGGEGERGPRDGPASSAATPEATSPRKQLPPGRKLHETPERGSPNTLENHHTPSGSSNLQGDAPRDHAGHARSNLSSSPTVASPIRKPTRLDDNWVPPPPDQLPPQARAAVSRWPDGAYAARCEVFAMHWRSASGRAALKTDWLATLAKWMLNDDALVMRMAKGGHVFAPPSIITGSTGAAGFDLPPVPEQLYECALSAAVREKLRGTMDVEAYDRWIAPHAIIIDAPDGNAATVRVVARNSYQRALLKGEPHTDRMMRAVKAVTGKSGVTVTVEVTQAEGHR